MNAEEYLNSLFDSARTAEPNINMTQIETSLSHAGIKTPTSTSLFTNKNIVIMGSSIVLIGAVYFFFNQPLHGPVSIKSSKEISLQTKVEKPLSANPFFHLNPMLKLKCKPKPSPVPIERGTQFASKNEPMETDSFKSSTGITAALETEHNHEQQHVIIPYIPNFMPSGNIDKSRCLAVNGRSINMMNIHLIELTDQELLPLGIEITDRGIVVTSNAEENGKPFSVTYSKAGSNMDILLKRVIKTDSNTRVSVTRLGGKNEVHDTAFGRSIGVCENKEFKISVSAGADQAITFPKIGFSGKYPEHALITDDLGQLWRSYKMDYKISNHENEKDPSSPTLSREQMKERDRLMKFKAEEELREKLAGYIPILVKSGEKNLPDDQEKHLWRADIIVWFEPSEQLFNALPSRISNDLRTEYHRVFVSKEASSCTYFETCRNMPGAIEKFQLYPNPTEDITTLEFNLTESRLLSASIYTINGQEVKSLFTDRPFDKGTTAHEFHINDLQEGIYLLIVTSNKGDMISRRLVRR